MTETVLVLDTDRNRRRRDLPAGAEVVDTVDRVRERARSRRELWIAPRSGDLALLGESDALLGLKGDHRLVIRDRVGPGRSEVLRAAFRYVVSIDDGVTLLPLDQLVEVMASTEREDLFVGVATDQEDRAVVLVRGTLAPLIVPLSFFGVHPVRAGAHLPRFEVIDFGQAIRFDEREASTDAVLYAFDPDYRRRRKALRMEQDLSFGGALRRLRILRGLSRSDFPGLSAREIARIERGEVERPHRRTLDVLATRLGVRPDQLASY